MNLLPHVSSNTLSSVHRRPAQPIDEQLTSTNRHRIEKLVLKLRDLTQRSLEGLYMEVFELLPYFEEDYLLHLIELLKLSPHLKEQQLHLALEIGNWYAAKLKGINFSTGQLLCYKKAMQFYAKAIQIAEEKNSFKLKECHRLTSRLFIHLVKDLHGPTFFDKLMSAADRDSADEFKTVYQRISRYSLFCTCEEDYKGIIVNLFYFKTTEALNRIHQRDRITQRQENEHYQKISQRSRKSPKNEFSREIPL